MSEIPLKKEEEPSGTDYKGIIPLLQIVGQMKGALTFPINNHNISPVMAYARRKAIDYGFECEVTRVIIATVGTTTPIASNGLLIEWTKDLFPKKEKRGYKKIKLDYWENQT